MDVTVAAGGLDGAKIVKNPRIVGFRETTEEPVKNFDEPAKASRLNILSTTTTGDNGRVNESYCKSLTGRFFRNFALEPETPMNEMDNNISNLQPDKENEMILYQPDSTLSLNVRVENETVWLNRNQIAMLFDRDVKTIGKHINNALKEELDGLSVIAKFATTASDGKTYQVEYYNIEMITSIGYRVKSKRGVQFRVWANKILKDFLLRGYSVNQRLLYMESRIDRRLSEHDKRLDDLTDKVDFFIRTSLPPKEGIFFNGQIFDAHEFICSLIKKAEKRIVIIDNYVDESVLVQLDNRNAGVSAIIYTGEISRTFRQSLSRHNRQYAPVAVRTADRIHERFLIVDDTLYHIGASIKDLGKKLFAFSRMETSPDVILEKL